eukprot:SAG11_NODE_1132_length_5752_cov_8.739685_7_plen_272_part_00
MFGNGGSSPAPPLGPLPHLPPSPPPSPDSSSADLEQYHAQCTTQNFLTCVPSCNATTQCHGFELLATIDGTDTKFSCNLANMLCSWVGAAALGGFLSRNVQAFVSTVISGAVGTYVLTLMEDDDVRTDLVVQPGQNVIISGDAGLAEAPRWGSGGFTIGDGGMLALTYIGVERVGTMRCHACWLSLSSMAVSLSSGIGRMFSSSDVQFRDAGTRVRLSAVTIPDHHQLGGELIGTMIVGEDGFQVPDPPNWGVANPRALGGTGWPCFSGPC